MTLKGIYIKVEVRRLLLSVCLLKSKICNQNLEAYMFFYLFHFEIIITHAPNPPIYSFLFSFSSIISFSLIAAKDCLDKRKQSWYQKSSNSSSFLHTVCSAIQHSNYVTIRQRNAICSWPGSSNSPNLCIALHFDGTFFLFYLKVSQ